MSAEGMARVVGEHRLIGVSCRCGINVRLDYYRYETHLADMLTAAGYGSMHDAWDDGHAASDDAWETPRDICDPPVNKINPYPETEP